MSEFWKEAGGHLMYHGLQKAGCMVTFVAILTGVGTVATVATLIIQALFA